MEGGWDRRFQLIGDPVLSLCSKAHAYMRVGDSSDFKCVRSGDGGAAYLAICIVLFSVPLLTARPLRIPYLSAQLVASQDVCQYFTSFRGFLSPVFPKESTFPRTWQCLARVVVAHSILVRRDSPLTRDLQNWRLLDCARRGKLLDFPNGGSQCQRNPRREWLKGGAPAEIPSPGEVTREMVLCAQLSAPRWNNPVRRPSGYSRGPYLCHFSFPVIHTTLRFRYISFLARQCADDTMMSSRGQGVGGPHTGAVSQPSSGGRRGMGGEQLGDILCLLQGRVKL